MARRGTAAPTGCQVYGVVRIGRSIWLPGVMNRYAQVSVSQPGGPAAREYREPDQGRQKNLCCRRPGGGEPGRRTPPVVRRCLTLASKMHVFWCLQPPFDAYRWCYRVGAHHVPVSPRQHREAAGHPSGELKPGRSELCPTRAGDGAFPPLSWSMGGAGSERCGAVGPAWCRLPRTGSDVISRCSTGAL